MRRMHLIRSLLVFATLALLTLPAAALDLSFSASWYWSSDPRWDALFDLESGVTYVYDLTAVRRGRPVFYGELRLTRSGSQVTVDYRVDRATGRVTAPDDPLALTGALVLAAVNGSQGLDYESLQLLLTPLRFAQWAELFAEARFRNGRVWEDYAQPPVRFEANEVGPRGGRVYEGRVRRGSETLFTLMIDLDEPLPVWVEAEGGDWRFTAELRTERKPQLILR